MNQALRHYVCHWLSVYHFPKVVISVFKLILNGQTAFMAKNWPYTYFHFLSSVSLVFPLAKSSKLLSMQYNNRTFSFHRKRDIKIAEQIRCADVFSPAPVRCGNDLPTASFLKATVRKLSESQLVSGPRGVIQYPPTFIQSKQEKTSSNGRL